MKQKIEEAVDKFLRDRWTDCDTEYEYNLDSIYSFKISGDICNPRSKELPHIDITFTQNVNGLVTRLNNSYLFSRFSKMDIDIRKTLIDGLYGQYQRLYKMEERVEIGFEHYYAVVNDNDKLRKENQSLKKQLEEEKAEHDKNMSRIVFAMNILQGYRDDKSEAFKNEYEKEIEKLIKENGGLKRENQDLVKSLYAWKDKYDKK